jgi:hypothetical protein
MCDICVFQIKDYLRFVLVDVSIKFMLAFVDGESFNNKQYPLNFVLEFYSQYYIHVVVVYTLFSYSLQV